VDISLVALSLVVGEEDLVRSRGQLIIARNGVLEIPGNPEQLGKNFPFRRIRESPEFLDEMLRLGGHDRIYLSGDRDIPEGLRDAVGPPNGLPLSRGDRTDRVAGYDSLGAVAAGCSVRVGLRLAAVSPVPDRSAVMGYGCDEYLVFLDSIQQ